MKREIKFRAWHNQQKRFINLNGVDINFKGCNNEGAVYLIYEQGNLRPFPIEDIDLMQFTSLKDKNGKEIYEGDIVKWISKFKDTNIPTPDKIGQVKYNQQGCVFHINYEINKKHYYKDLNADYGDGDTYIMHSIEVIGNIYENPELI